MADEAFRTFAMDPPQTAFTLRAKLLKRKAELAEPIVQGYINSYEGYREAVGRMQGLDEAIAICDELIKKGE